MPRTKGSKNRPKINTTNDYASQIAEKQETIASLNTEIASIQKAIEEQKNTLKEKKTALKKAEKEVACFLQDLFGENCKTFLANVASPNWRKLQSFWTACLSVNQTLWVDNICRIKRQ